MQVAPVVAIVHPGAMGAALGSVLTAVSDRPVLWAGEGRTPDSTRRAAAAGLRDVGTLSALCAQAEIVVSVCPPGAAEEVATAVVKTGFEGLYIDANAVSPATARRVGDLFDRYVDGGIVGPPPTGPGMTRLYLAGAEAEVIAQAFNGTLVETRIVSGAVGAASAVKMSYAAWTKGTSALLLAIRALAEHEGVTDALLGEWDLSQQGLAARSDRVSAGVGPKAWRFEEEMREIAASLADAGLPPDFHLGAAEIYRRLAPLKGATQPGLDDVLLLLAE